MCKSLSTVMACAEAGRPESLDAGVANAETWTRDCEVRPRCGRRVQTRAGNGEEFQEDNSELVGNIIATCLP